MTDWEEYYFDRLISEYNMLNKYNDMAADCEARCCKLEKQIENIFGQEKANEMFNRYLEYAEQMENEQ